MRIAREEVESSARLGRHRWVIERTVSWLVPAVDDPIPSRLATNLVDRGVLPPKLATAVYQAAAKVPGVRKVDDLTDASGRHGVAVSRTGSDGTTTSWIFDPKTYQFLGERAVGKDSSQNAQTAILARGVVDQVGQLPTS